MLGVGPVAAPHQVGGRVGVQQLPRGLAARRGTGGAGPVAVGGRQLDPDAAAASLPQQILETGVGDAKCRVGTAEVVDHHAAAGLQQGRHDIGQARRLHMDLDMPAERVDAVEQVAPGGRRQAGQVQPDQVQADADHAGLGQGAQPGVVDGGIHHRHAAQPRRRGAQRLEQMAVVGAQEAGLHQYAVRQPVRVQQAQVLGQGGVVVGRVAASVRQRQALVKDVGVGVDGGAGDRWGQGCLLRCSVWAPRRCASVRFCKPDSRQTRYSFLFCKTALFILD